MPVRHWLTHVAHYQHWAPLQWMQSKHGAHSTPHSRTYRALPMYSSNFRTAFETRNIHTYTVYGCPKIQQHLSETSQSLASASHTTSTGDAYTHIQHAYSKCHRARPQWEHHRIIYENIFLTFCGEGIIDIYFICLIHRVQNRTELKMDDISVEVCGENGAYYKVCMPKIQSSYCAK